jgi:hypothetical protein
VEERSRIARSHRRDGHETRDEDLELSPGDAELVGPENTTYPNSGSPLLVEMYLSSSLEAMFNSQWGWSPADWNGAEPEYFRIEYILNTHGGVMTLKTGQSVLSWIFMPVLLIIVGFLAGCISIKTFGRLTTLRG